MKRPAILSISIMLLVLVAVQWSAPGAAWANASQDRQMTVILADGAAVRATDQGTELVTSFIGLLATLQQDMPLAFISADDPSLAYGPTSANDPEFVDVQREIEAGLRTSEQKANGGGLDYALLAAADFLRGERAAPGSQVYVITGSGTATNFAQLSHRASLLVPMFQESDWTVHGLSLPGAPNEAIDFLDAISARSGGSAYELSVSTGFKSLTDSILTNGTKGSLNQIGRRVLELNDLFTSVVSIPPGTQKTTLLFFRESSYGSLRLSNPSGFEVSVGDRKASYVTETPHVVIWRLVDPAPGNWRIDARGMEGLISAWEYSSNKYSLVIMSPGPVPLDEPSTMSAYVTDGVNAVSLEGVRLNAILTTPEGASMVLAMNDEGVEGDAKAADGFYSVTLPPLPTEGRHEIELELLWRDYNHRLSSQTSFETRPFPEIVVKAEQLTGLEPGERTKVATVYVHVQGAPYPVPPERLAASVASPEGQEGNLALEPRRLFGDGPAWEYDVYFTPQPGHHTLVLRLSLDYAGRPYTNTSQSFLISSEALKPSPLAAEAAPVSLLVAPAAPPKASPVTAAPAAPPPSPVVDPQGFPWMELVLTVTLVGGVAAVAVFLLTRTQPHGYLYGDGDEPLIDFAGLKRHPILRLMFGGYVKGDKLNLPGLESVAFQFSRRGIKLRMLREHPSVRVNNQPLTGEAAIHDRTWIGARGKLYAFMTSMSPTQEGATAD